MSKREVIDLTSDDDEKQQTQQQQRTRAKVSKKAWNKKTSAAATSKGQILSNVNMRVQLESGDNGIVTYDILEQIMKTQNSGLSRVKTCLQNPTTTAGATAPPTAISTLQHIQQKDKWSCGYRNVQMMLSAIIPHLPSNHIVFQRIPRRQPNPSIPNVLNMQQGLEQAWKEGFDPKGAQHYNYKLINSKSKIGAVEAANLLWYYGLDATVVQFIYCDESRRLLPKFIRAYFSKVIGQEGCPFCPDCVQSSYCVIGLLEMSSSSLMDDIINTTPSCDCPLLPIYLQWEGHSVSIVGIDDDGETLLVFDPLKQGNQIHTTNALRLSSKILMKKDTQIIHCTLRSISNDDRSRNKNAGAAGGGETTNILTAAPEAVHRKQLQMMGN